jgi:ketosteroid isomerase-like protein
MSESSNDVRGMVRRAQDAWNVAFNRGDAAGVAALYTQNATLLPPTHSVIKGTAAIRDFWQGLITAGFKDHGIEMLDAEAEGGLAIGSGKWSANGPGEGGKVQRFEGLVVTVMRRQGDGAWKACLHTWN